MVSVMTKKSFLESENKIARENHYDLLRVASTLAVIIIHANWSFFSDKYETSNGTVLWSTEALINIVMRFCVPCFVMISGAFNIRKAKGIGFYQKTTWKVAVPAFVIGVILIACQMLLNFIRGNSVMQGIRVTSIIACGPFDFWYVYMQLGLYLVTPIVYCIKNAFSRKSYTLIALGMTFWAMISQATSTQKLAYSIGVVIAFLSY